MNLKIKKGDKVKVVSGKDKGKEGVVEKVFDGEVLVPGVNLFKKHNKQQTKTRQKGIIDVARPLSMAKIVLICGKCGQATRVGFQGQGKEKVRICRKCQGLI